MLVRRALVSLSVVLASLVVIGAPASADVRVGQTMSTGAAISLGQQGFNAYFTVINRNSAPNTTENDTITSIRLAPGCGAVGTVTNPCPTPDPGILTLNSTAIGTANTACAGVTFSVSAPDVRGVVTFTAASPVVLAPPGGVIGSDRCSVTFVYGASKLPAIDSDAAVAGLQTHINLVSNLTGSPSGVSQGVASTLQMTVKKAAPKVTGQASPKVALGGSVSDRVTVTGLSGVVAPTGTVTFKLFGPNTTCGSPAVSQSTTALSATSSTVSAAMSASFTPTKAGTYKWMASYSGDANFAARTTACSIRSQHVVVSL
jgi:hypothetical protein